MSPRFAFRAYTVAGPAATGISRGRVISSRIVGRPEGLAERPVRLDDLLPIGRVVLLEDLVQVPQAIVGDRREEMVGDVHVLAVDEHGPSREGVGEEDAGVGQAARVRVRMLVDVPQEHEEHEGRHQRDQPEQREVHGRCARRWPSEGARAPRAGP